MIEGNFPKLNRDKVPSKILYYLMYCQTLGWAEVPNYSMCKRMFDKTTDDDVIPRIVSERVVSIPTEMDGKVRLPESQKVAQMGSVPAEAHAKPTTKSNYPNTKLNMSGNHSMNMSSISGNNLSHMSGNNISTNAPNSGQKVRSMMGSFQSETNATPRGGSMAESVAATPRKKALRTY